jgi:hypothetical protein
MTHLTINLFCLDLQSSKECENEVLLRWTHLIILTHRGMLSTHPSEEITELTANLEEVEVNGILLRRASMEEFSCSSYHPSLICYVHFVS